jgi:hypothetical protein
MIMNNVKMWACKKYRVAIMAKNAAAFCARRFAAANYSNGTASVGFGHCRTCAWGAIHFELGKNKGIKK